MKHVAILGCGPAGLLAAHAAQINRCHFDIYSRLVKSDLYGAQYLHEPISGITGMPEDLSYFIEGSPEEYRFKVYGDQWNGSVSPEDFELHHKAWDIREAYDNLWSRYGRDIHHTEIDPKFMSWDGLEKYDIVISTLPRPIWVQGDLGEFKHVKIWAVGDAPDLGVSVPFHTGENTVVCDGTDEVSWYRASNIFGHGTVEWPGSRKPPVAGIKQVIKPIEYNGLAAPDFIHLGRYGKWRKGVLTTDAFNEALRVTA